VRSNAAFPFALLATLARSARARLFLRCALAAAAVTLAAFRAEAGKGVDGVVNLNTAPPEVLGLIPGIGPAKAAEIVRYRAKRPFRTVDELVRIRGIGRKMVRRVRVHLAVAGPTTATAASGRIEVPPPAPPPPAPKPVVARRIGPPVVGPAARAKLRVAYRWPSHGACARPR
jgi:competence ComEA-like helix-hairpin-helix protein